MLSRIKALLKPIASKPRRVFIVVAACLFLIIIPLLAFMGYALHHSYELQSRQLMQQREFGTRLAATAVASELDSIRIFGSWYSRTPRIRDLVNRESWQALSEDMDRIVAHLPSVVRMFASDKQGRLWADSPRKPAVHGVDFSFRDWFKGAMDRRDVYLSHAYRRTAEPRIQVASMAFPVLGDGGEPIAVMVFQLSLDTVFSWASHAALEGGGRLAFIDQYRRSFGIDERSGKMEMNTDPAEQPGIPTTIDSPDGDVEVLNNGRDLVVYAKVPGWNWGVYISESLDEIFSGRNQELRVVVLVIVLILTLCLAAAGTALLLLRVLVAKESALRQANAELMGANRNLHDFTHAVSHDLRAPLRAMSGFAEALAEDHGEHLDDQGRHYLDRIKAGSRKLGRMIEDLLGVARIPQRELQLRDVNLSQISLEIAEELQSAEPEREADIRIQPDLRARCDSTLLSLVLRNLLQNAWKFTRGVDATKIEFGRENVRGEVVYFVKDNGVGFDPEYIDKLFNMFQRLHSEAEFEGNGIGLAASRQAIELHGGRIWAEGREQEGAVFHFTIPEDYGTDGR